MSVASLPETALAMRCFVGIDLGSTTTKAVILDEEETVLGRGITNSRSNYDVACQVALTEAIVNARFSLIEQRLTDESVPSERSAVWLDVLERHFRAEQYRAQLGFLDEQLGVILETIHAAAGPKDAVSAILSGMRAEVDQLYAAGTERKSDFFRDLAGSRFIEQAEAEAQTRGLGFETLVGFFDKAILEVENRPLPPEAFDHHIRASLQAMEKELGSVAPELAESVRHATSIVIDQEASVGTGYGRQRLPFPKEQIRSEILCHGLGAHAMFPNTRTVLDIGGQDTKAIQVDNVGIVTSFQMNDRCAAGCGRYLGYIADEMNLGLHQLGPLARRSDRPTRINSTCTVFAGAELRERLSLGERREDILAGLHRAIILRAMSLLARSGGIEDEFTFTGGVAKNPAAVDALEGLVDQNYGAIKINISPDSIYTGALGAALFALRDAKGKAKETAL